MKLKDILRLSIENIRHRQLRSWLTILGIVIGVASIISLISISIGIKDQISQRVNTLGTNIITISPGGASAQRTGFGGLRPPTQDIRLNFGGRGKTEITFREADELRRLAGVYKLDARVSGRSTVTYKDKNATISITGTEPDSFKDSVGLDVIYGRYLLSSDQYSAVVGYGIANSTFNDFDILNKQIKIKGTAFRVVGILNQSGGFGGSDSSIFIPQKIAQSVLNQSTVSQIIVVSSSDHDTDEVASNLENTLMSLHGVTKETEDFQVTTASSLAATVSGITDVLSLFLGVIASISLLVGGIGVANTMFMSVLEQTKQIGVLKSLGAKNKDIIYIFLSEAGIIGLIGGMLGVLLSFLASGLISLAGLPTNITLELILGGLFFSIFTGIIAGISPARNAAKIPPIEALRYE